MKNNKERKVSRGEIYWYDFGNSKGSIQCGRRPAIILQSDDGNQNSPTTIVAPITGEIKGVYYPMHIVLGASYGLPEVSMILLEQMQTVNQSDLLGYVGKISQSYLMDMILMGIAKTFDLPQSFSDNIWSTKCSIKSLCPRCLQQYKENPNVVVRKLKTGKAEERFCSICGEEGLNYLVYESDIPKDQNDSSKEDSRKTAGKSKFEVPLWEKATLTVEEAEAYSGIGRTKLRQISDREDCPFVLWNGTKRLIKRKQLEEYIDKEYSI